MGMSKNGRNKHQAKPCGFDDSMLKPGSYICTDMPPSNGCVLQRRGASHGDFLDHFDGHKQ